jgi:hypothetical protein
MSDIKIGLRVFDNRVLGIVFGLKRDEVMGECAEYNLNDDVEKDGTGGHVA